MSSGNLLLNPWQTVHAIPSLPGGELHIWRIGLPLLPDVLDSFHSLLTPQEVERANRLRQPQARQQFIAGRGILRRILAAASGLDPHLIPITTAPNGKPAFAQSGIAFNVAHSGDTVLIALHRGGSIGIDIECIDPTRSFMEIAQHSFTPSENLSLLAIDDPDERRDTFYQLWTRKEAIAKADGRGLVLPFTSFHIPPFPANSTPIPIDQTETTPRRTFYVTDLPLETGLAGAMALDSPIHEMKLLMFPRHELR